MEWGVLYDSRPFKKGVAHQGCGVQMSLGRVRDMFGSPKGQTELVIGGPGAKFDAESDFEVRLAVAPPKPDQIAKN